jgi:eukaryotic-like serine/threonine-protein kinase
VRAPPSGAAKPSLRLHGGLVCPRCRGGAEHPDDPSAIIRCPADGYVFIRAEALADADGDPFLGGTVAGRYVILGKLGAGSMGTVYRARHEAMGRDVAVKILRADRIAFTNAKARFVREARAMSMLASPHTVTVFDFGELPVDPKDEELEITGSSLYLAMELLSGESLAQRLDRVTRLPFEEASLIARHALLSLVEAHEKGVIHRDLKPDNLFLARSPGAERGEICKVLDFGIAKVMSDTVRGVDALETQEGMVFGTPRYMSPEQAQGRALDARSDLYALGVLLYQMLTGRPPFVDDDAVVVMAHHIRTLPAAPLKVAPDAGIPRSLSDLVLRTLSKDPSRRPATARELIAELDRALEDARASEKRDAEPRKRGEEVAAPGVWGQSPASWASPHREPERKSAPPPLPRRRISAPPPLPAEIAALDRKSAPPPLPAEVAAPERKSAPPPLPRRRLSAPPPLPTEVAAPGVWGQSPASQASPHRERERKSAPPPLPKHRPPAIRAMETPSPGATPSRSSTPPPLHRRRTSVPPSVDGEREHAREGLEPNSLSSPPAKSISTPPPRGRSAMTALIIVGAVAAGVAGGVLAFGFARPAPVEIAAGHGVDGVIRALASFVSAALREAKAAATASREAEPAAPIEIEIEDTDVAQEIGGSSSARSDMPSDLSSDMDDAPAAASPPGAKGAREVAPSAAVPPRKPKRFDK